jgi:hypothetical protein
MILEQATMTATDQSVDSRTAAQPEWQVYVLPSIHQDISYLKTAAEDMQLYEDEYLKYLDLMEQDPTWCYSSEFAWTVRYFLDKHPGQKERLARFVQEGRFGITAQCSGFDPSFYSGEMIIREIAVAKDWLSKTFGYAPRAIDLADVPDFTPQLPQILRGCEVDLFLYTRAGGGRNRNGSEQHIGEFPGMWELLDNELMQVAVLYFGQDHQTGELRALYPGYWDWKREHMHDQPISRLWHYVGLNGDRVLAYAACNRYSGLYGLQLPEGTLPRHWFENEEVFLSNLKPGIDPAYSALGVIGTDEEAINAQRVLEKIAAWNREKAPQRGIRLQLSTAEQFTARMVQAVNTGEVAPGEYSGIAPGWFFDAYDADDFNIIQNRLPVAEMLAGINTLLGRAAYPTAALDRAWNILWMISHNQRNDEEYFRAVRDSARATNQILDQALRRFSRSIQPARPSQPILVFNGLNWQRSERVRVIIPAGEPTTVVDEQGRAVSSALVETGSAGTTLEFLAEDVPGIGYRTFYLEPAQASVTDLEAGNNWIQNCYFRVALDAEGYLHLTDRASGHELAGAGATSGPLRLVGWGQRGDLHWKMLGYTTACNGLKTILTLHGQISNSPATISLSLTTKQRRVDIDVDINWDGQRGARVYLPLPFSYAPNELRLGVACGHVPYVRPTAMMNLRGTRLSRRSAATSFSTFWVLPQPHDPIPGDGFDWAYMQKWAYLGAASGGIVLASGRRNGLIVGDGVLAIPLLRTPHGRGQATRKRRLYEKGPHHWALACTTVRGVDEAPRFGWSVAQPLISSAFKYGSGPLPSTAVLLTLQGNQAIWMAFKRGFDGESWAARFFEASDQDGEVTFQANPALGLVDARIEQANLLEQPQGVPLTLTDGSVTLPLHGLEIKTLRITRGS